MKPIQATNCLIREDKETKKNLKGPSSHSLSLLFYRTKKCYKKCDWLISHLPNILISLVRIWRNTVGYSAISKVTVYMLSDRVLILGRSKNLSIRCYRFILLLATQNFLCHVRINSSETVYKINKQESDCNL